MRLKKKGYFFVVDALIGSTIIFLSLMIILNSGSRPAKVQYNYDMAEEYASFIMNSKIQDINNKLVQEMITDSRITNVDYTVAEQVDKFYFENNLVDARLLVQNLTEPLIPVKYGFSYSIINGTTITNIYNRSSPDINSANLIIASKKITFLTVNSTSIFGPAAIEVKIWI